MSRTTSCEWCGQTIWDTETECDTCKDLPQKEKEKLQQQREETPDYDPSVLEYEEWKAANWSEQYLANMAGLTLEEYQAERFAAEKAQKAKEEEKENGNK